MSRNIMKNISLINTWYQVYKYTAVYFGTTMQMWWLGCPVSVNFTRGAAVCDHSICLTRLPSDLISSHLEPIFPTSQSYFFPTKYL